MLLIKQINEYTHKVSQLASGRAGTRTAVLRISVSASQVCARLVSRDLRRMREHREYERSLSNSLSAGTRQVLVTLQSTPLGS